MLSLSLGFFFFFQAEDGIRDGTVTGVQTCALPISGLGQEPGTRAFIRELVRRCPVPLLVDADGLNALAPSGREPGALDALRRETATVLTPRSEEHTSELQSQFHLVCRLLLEKKKKKYIGTNILHKQTRNRQN